MAFRAGVSFLDVLRALLTGVALLLSGLQAEAGKKDLHSHYSGAPSAQALIRTAFQLRLPYPVALLDDAGVSYDRSQIVASSHGPVVPLDSRFFSPAQIQRLQDRLSIPAETVVDFQVLEKTYALRAPITKSLQAAPLLLEMLANEYRAQGVTEAELSLGNLLDESWLRVLTEAADRIEREKSVRFRFLVGLWRHEQGEARESRRALLEKNLNHPLVVGADIMGEESNSVRELEAEFVLLREARAKRPGFVIQVHAGESRHDRTNIESAIHMGATRIVHGIFGLNENILQLIRQRSIEVVLSPTSNLRLGNIHSVSEIPLTSYLRFGIFPSVGTDSPGIFQTSLPLEERALAEAFPAEKAYFSFLKAQNELSSFDEVRKFVSSRNKKVVAFAGFNRSDYQSPEAFAATVRQILENHDPKTTLVQVASNRGILKAAEIARSMGFETVGTFSQLTEPDRLAELKTKLDHVFLIGDQTWGGYADAGKRKLTELSRVFLEIPEAFYFLGGGPRMALELEMLERFYPGKPLQFYDLHPSINDYPEMRARNTARRLGHPLMGAASGDKALAVREIPPHLSTWPELRAFVLKDAATDSSLRIRENGESLTIENGKDRYDLVFHQGRVIQYSSLTNRERGYVESVQFGRGSARDLRSIFQQDFELFKLYRIVTERYGVQVRESDRSLESSSVRSGLVFPELGRPFIVLSDAYGKHPIFGFIHEAQHLLNQAVLPVLIEKLFPLGRGEDIDRESVRNFLDEYLSVRAELELFERLAAKHPSLANAELMELRQSSERELREYIYHKWKGFYRWPEKIRDALLRAPIDGAEFLRTVRDFHVSKDRRLWPENLQRQTYFDQRTNPKLVDEKVIAAPNNDKLPWIYRPESGMSFPVRTVWVPEKELNLAIAENQLPEQVRGELVRTQNGERSIRFFVHPLSERYFAGMIAKYLSTFEYVATPSSSNRTLLVRSMETGVAFYVKTSLAVEVAGIERTIPFREVSRSVGHSMLLASVAKPGDQVLYQPEPFAAIPKGMERGGQIVRLIETNAPGSGLNIPLFSFFDDTDLSGKIASSLGLARSEFLRRYVLEPMVRSFSDLMTQKSIAHEIHSQNVLVEVGPKYVPTGRFVMKDLGGITADFTKYPQMRERVPVFGDFESEYYQKDIQAPFKRTFEVFFRSGVLYGVDQYLQKKEPGYKPGSIFGVMPAEPKAAPAAAGMCKRVFF